MRTRLMVPALVATLLASVAVAPTPAASAPTVPTRASADVVGYIVFTSAKYSRSAGQAKNFEGPGDVRVIAGDGSLGVTLTNGPANDRDPVFSPDVQTVAFSSDRANRRGGVTDLYVINVYTNQLRRLTYGAGTGSASWTPDGKALVVDDRKGLLLVPAAGGKTTRLLRTPKGQYDHSPTWSADGTHVLFTRSQLSAGKTISESIWSVSADGGNAHRVVGGTGEMKFSSQPAVSRDGFTIAWVTRTKKGSTIWLGDLYFGLLDNVRKFVVDKTHFLGGPAFAPDSSALVVTRSRGNARYGSEMMTYDLADGKALLLLGVSKGALRAPNWAD